MHGQVIYELHIGTFTPEGTFDSAITRLDALKDLGITVIEVMPVAEFPGRWNWGYDGVGLYAPAHVYGDPEALKRAILEHKVKTQKLLESVKKGVEAGSVDDVELNPDCKAQVSG